MTFREKIDKIKAVSKLSIKKLAENSGLKTTLEKAYSDNREMKDITTQKFLQNLRINAEWWRDGTGEIFLSEDNQQKDIKPGIENLEKSKELFDRYTENQAITRELWERLNKDFEALDKELERVWELVHMYLPPPTHGVKRVSSKHRQ